MPTRIIVPQATFACCDCRAPQTQVVRYIDMGFHGGCRAVVLFNRDTMRVAFGHIDNIECRLNADSWRTLTAWVTGDAHSLSYLFADADDQDFLTRLNHQTFFTLGYDNDTEVFDLDRFGLCFSEDAFRVDEDQPTADIRNALTANSDAYENPALVGWYNGTHCCEPINILQTRSESPVTHQIPKKSCCHVL